MPELADDIEIDDGFYQALPKTGRIRLLLLKPAHDFLDPIICNLKSAEFRKSKYSALSYCWGLNETGDTTMSRNIVINGVTKPITRNLFEGLRRLRSHHGSLRIWIDAVCINQRDVKERNCQVAQMGDIYRNAQKVLVGLGEGRSESEDTIVQEFLEQLSQHRLHDYGQHWTSCLTGSLLESSTDGCACSLGASYYQSAHELDDGFFDGDEQCSVLKPYITTSSRRARLAARKATGLMFFLLRRYWRRRWILQEVGLANALEWFWGPCRHELPLDGYAWAKRVQSLMSNLLKAFEESGDLRWSNELSRLLPDLDIRRSFEPFKSLAELIDTLGLGANRRLLGDLFRYSDYMECSDPRDRLFAIASLCTERITPDYALSFSQTCILCTQLLLRSGRRYRWHTNLNEKLSSSNNSGSESLPTWVLDIRQGFAMDLDALESPERPLPCRVQSSSILICDMSFAVLSWT